MNEKTNIIEKEKIEEIIQKLQWLLKEMENNKIETLEIDGTTYLTNEFIHIIGTGYIDLNNIEKYISKQEVSYAIK